MNLRCRLGCLLAAAFVGWCPAAVRAEVVTLIEDFEFATSDGAAAQGVTDITDWQNRPTFYLHGIGKFRSQGDFSIGTDALFGASGEFEPGTFIGFRREISTDLFPEGQVPLQFTYGDPEVEGPVPADRPLSDLMVIGDVFGHGGFADGPLGTHLWINLIDAEGERFNFVNFSETALYSKLFTFDVVLGQGLIRIDPDSLIDVPDGDRLLTEIVAFEVLIQDDDEPPTGAGEWYLDNLRIGEPDPPGPGDADGDGDVDLNDISAFMVCFTGPDAGPFDAGCEVFDFGADGDIDFADFDGLQLVYTGSL